LFILLFLGLGRSLKCKWEFMAMIREVIGLVLGILMGYGMEGNSIDWGKIELASRGDIN
jgi:hypothetical protein